jgi:hypothetical protein
MGCKKDVIMNLSGVSVIVLSSYLLLSSHNSNLTLIKMLPQSSEVFIPTSNLDCQKSERYIPLQLSIR